MRPSTAYLICLTAFIAMFTTTYSLPSSGIQYDVVVVGGGPSGLSATSTLGRMRIKTLMVDSGVYRNQDTRLMHDVIGNDGTIPAVFRAKARDQISRYPSIVMRNGTVTEVVYVQNSQLGPHYILTEESGTCYTAKLLILGTGIRDELPNTPGLREAWSKGMFWCGFCDGYEHRDQNLGILGSIVDVPSSALQMSGLNSKMVAFTNGTYTADNVAILDESHPEWPVELASRGVVIENRIIAAIERLQDGGVVKNETHDNEYDLFRIHLRDGTIYEVGAFFTNFPTCQYSYLSIQLGAQLYDGKVAVDPKTMRAVGLPGVFVVGDASSGNVTNIPYAMYSGKRAAVCAVNSARTGRVPHVVRSNLEVLESALSRLEASDE